MSEKMGMGPAPKTPPGAKTRLPLPIGALTQWGVIAAIGWTGGERYYWMVDGNDTAMIPASTVEAAQRPGEPASGEPAPTPSSPPDASA